MAIRALIFDVDGTLAETEEVHRTAFNHAFAEAGLDWHWDQSRYCQLLQVTGGRERIAHFMRQQGISPDDRANEIAALHRRKNDLYARKLADGIIALRPGVEALMAKATAAGAMLAVATTTSRSNLSSLILATPLAQFQFASIVCGEDVSRKKPDPEAYALVLERLGLHPHECLAFEDSVNGLRSASAAGIRTIVTPGIYTIADDFAGAALIVDNLDEVVGEWPFADDIFPAKPT